jgi:glucose/arabinose dehydrogenase
MHQRLATSLAVVVVTGLVVAGCSSHDDAKATKTTTTTKATSSSSNGTTTTTTATNLAAVNVKLTKLAELQRPTAMAIRPGDDTTLYIVEKVGRVRTMRNGKIDATPALDITSLVGSSSNEQGLLGLAFSPDGSKLYVDYTNKNGDTRVDEYAVDATGAITTSSRRQVLAQPQPQVNHNGGELGFGPDGLLYISFGDGGNAGDQGPGHVSGGNGQSLGTLLGKILRINPTPSNGQPYTIPPDNPFVNTAGARPEIWSYGLRNPWRFSWDKQTGDFWIGDVGQDAWEEVDLATKSSGGARGVNYGWNVWEGTHRYRDGDAPGAVMPLFDYSHENGGNCAVTGGYVYRGTKIPALRGGYLYADYCGGMLRALAAKDGKLAQERILPVNVPGVNSFGQDASGELYVLTDGGDVFRVDPA